MYTLNSAVLGACLLLIASVSLAAPPKPDFDSLAEELALSGSDKQAFVTVMEKHRQQRDTLREEAENQGFQHHQSMRRMRDDHRDEIRALLGEEQFETFEKNLWKRHHRDKGSKERGFKW